MKTEYSQMSSAELISEQDAWLAVISTPVGPGYPSNAARNAAEHQLALVEAWYHRRLLENQK